MSEIQELDRKTFFLFVGHLNSHHQNYLNSVSLIDCQGIAAFFFQICPVVLNLSKSQHTSSIIVWTWSISITSIIYKVYKKFSFKEGICTTDALLLLTHDRKSPLDKRAKLWIGSLDFSTAFHLVNHKSLLYKLNSMRWPIFDVFKDFLLIVNSVF